MREFEEFAFGFVQNVENIDRIVESERLNLRAEADEFAGEIFLRHDAGVEFDVGSRSHACCESRNAHGAAHLIEGAEHAQLFGYGEHIDRLRHAAQGLNGFVDFLVFGVVEAFGLQDVDHLAVGVLLEHQSTEHGILEFKVLRLQFTELVDHFGGRLRLALILSFFLFFGLFEFHYINYIRVFVVFVWAKLQKK